MAYVVAKPHGRWELRESHATPKGPRSRTLATFRRLAPEQVERAIARSAAPLTAADVIRAARRAGAPVEHPPANAAAEKLLAELSRGNQPTATLRRALADALGPASPPLSDTERAASEWLGASAERRGRALWDLLLLADRFPTRKRSRLNAFPRLESDGS